MDKPSQNNLGTSKVAAGLDPLSQMRDKKSTSNPIKPPTKKFMPEMEPRFIDFDKYNTKKNVEPPKTGVNTDPSPLQPSIFSPPAFAEEIKPEPKPVIQTGFRDLKTFGFLNEEKLPGEVILETADSSIILNSSMCDGKLILTNFKLHFRPVRTEFYKSYQLRPEFFQMPIMSIEKLGKYPEKKTNYLYIDLQTKDMRVFKFRVPSENFKEGEKVFTLLEAFITKKKKEHMAIDFAQNFKHLDQTYHGWEIYDIFREFERERADVIPRKVQEESKKEGEGCALKYCDNANGQVCLTYPEYFIVPSRASDELIHKSSKFRTKERVPALTYCYRQIVNGQITRTYMWRSSQCKSGLGSVQRSFEDEELLKIIGETSDLATNQQDKYFGVLKIFDARPFWNAVGNAVTGKGYENKDNYKNSDVSFLDIHNIHKVRESYKKMMIACLSQENASKWFSSIDNSGWFHHLSTIITGSLQVAEALKKGFQSLVHCSDGWDRTSQILSLTQIMLDPFFRTIEGFVVLIEKDWINFGHQFALRCGHCEVLNESQKSPILVQFLDCVHQIMSQFPLSFEFNIKFLTDIAYHLYSCYFGTFLCDSVNERIRNKLEERTVSLWSYLLSNKEKYLNPFYRESQQIDMNEVWPNPSLKVLRLWKEHFLAYGIETKEPYQIFPDAFFLEDNFYIEHFRSQEERKLLKMRVTDLNQDVWKLKKILHKYEEKFGKLERKKHKNNINNEENNENGGALSKSPPTEEENLGQKGDKTGN